MKKSNTPRSQALAPQVLRKGEEKEERRKINTQTHSEGPCRGGSDRIPTYICGEGGSGEKQGEKKWWEDDRREKDHGAKLKLLTEEIGLQIFGSPDYPVFLDDVKDVY